MELNEVTNDQIKIIQSLENQKQKLFEANDVSQIIDIAKEVLAATESVKPAKLHANSSVSNDEKGKVLIRKVLAADIEDLQNGTYSNLPSQRFAVATTIQLLMGVFAMISAEDLIQLLKNK